MDEEINIPSAAAALARAAAMAASGCSSSSSSSSGGIIVAAVLRARLPDRRGLGDPPLPLFAGDDAVAAVGSDVDGDADAAPSSDLRPPLLARFPLRTIRLPAELLDGAVGDAAGAEE